MALWYCIFCHDLTLNLLNSFNEISVHFYIFNDYSLEMLKSAPLTHWGRVTHICVGKLGHHCFRQWLGACSAPSHYLNQCWNIVNWTLRNKLQWNLNRNSIIFIQENAFENVVWKMAAILTRPQCVKRTNNGLTWSILWQCNEPRHQQTWHESHLPQYFVSHKEKVKYIQISNENQQNDNVISSI